METQVDVLQGDNITTYIVGWRTGIPPEENEDLNRDLGEFPDGIVLTGFGGDASYVVDLDSEADPEAVADVFRSYQYRVIPQLAV